jgi:hypothetical protein
MHPPFSYKPGHLLWPHIQVIPHLAVYNFARTLLPTMGLPTFLLALVSLGVYALYRFWDSSRRNRIPTGLKPLPGPKGKITTSHTQRILLGPHRVLLSHGQAIRSVAN